MLHPDLGSPLIVGADVTVGHHAIPHGCTVGESALIGMGAITRLGWTPPPASADQEQPTPPARRGP